MCKSFQTQCLPLLGWLLGCALTLCTGCKDDGYSSPPGYDLNEPDARQLGKVLNEISGLAYVPDSNTLIAISDNKKKIYGINPRTNQLRDVAEDFYGTQDYEEVVYTDSLIYALISDGTILGVPPGAQDSNKLRTFPSPFTGKNDFETLYYDPSANGLILMCKSCAHEKGQSTRTAFRFDPATGRIDSAAYFTVDEQKVKELVKNEDADFKPSAAAIHPVTGQLYILASAGNLLVVTDLKGGVQQAYLLNPDQHPQAEGIAFAPNGDMYISNEGKYGVATLQIFRYNPRAARRTAPTKQTER